MNDPFADLPRGHFGAILADPPWHWKPWGVPVWNGEYRKDGTKIKSQLPLQGADMTTWTEERTAQFRDLYAQGLSHSLIGKELGVSRNACIGKAARMGLPGRRGAISKRAAVHKPLGYKSHQRPPQARRGPQRLTRYIDERIGASKPFVLDEARFAADLAAANPVSLVELQAHHCRFPVGEPGNPAKPMMYCGAAKCGEDYSSYCAAHHVFARSGRRVA